MNRKQLNLLIVLFVLIGGLGLFLYSRQTASWKESDASAGQKIFPDFPLNEIAEVTIKNATNELTLVKGEEKWRVKERWNYPANFSEVSGLLRKIWELKSVRALQVGPSQLGRLQLLPPDKGTNSGTLVEFKDKSGKTLKSLLAGKQEMRETQSESPMGGGGYPVGRYLMAPGTSQTVWLVSETFSDLDTKPDRWLNKDFFKVEKLRSVSVAHTNQASSFKVYRETEGGDLKLADAQEGESLDSSKASGLGYALSSPYFNDIASPEVTAEETGLDQPITATLETFDNFTYSVKIGKSTTNDNHHVKVAVEGAFAKERTAGPDEKPEDKERLDKEFQDKVKKLEDKLKQEKEFEQWTYLVSKWTVDALLKERKDLLAEKKDEEKKEADEENKEAADAPTAEPKTEPLFPPPLPEPKPEPEAKNEDQ